MAKILTANDSNEAKKLARLCKLEKIRRIHHGIYTDDLTTDIPKIIRSNWMDIIPHIVREGILSFRTAVELKPIPYKQQAIIFITSSYTKTIHLPGLVIKVLQGNHKAYLESLFPNIQKSNMARMLLENLTQVKGKDYKGIKTIGIEGVEKFLAKELRYRGEDHLNRLRDEAKQIAITLNYETEFKKLNNIISALLATHVDADVLQTPYARAITQKKPFDQARINLFENFSIYLKKCKFLTRTYQYSKNSFKNLTFFESYFSNYIEGIEFIIDEAEEIVFKGIEINHRHADSHDILANFYLSNDYAEMIITPESPNDFIGTLQRRHAYLMKERPDKRPGEFKEKPNKAGNTYFVMPDDVVGTLCYAFEIYRLLNVGMEKALFMQFLVSEVHPFEDGNGRLARIMMNAELVQAGLYKIIIPTVHRENYLNGLKLASRDNNFYTYCKVMDQAQAYTANIPWQDYGEAREKIETDNANLTPDEGLPIFYRAIRKLPLSYFAES